MEKSKKILVNIFQETSKIFWILFKVILPVVIIIRILELIGVIPYLAKFLEPLTSFIGIDGSLGLVWMAAILVNIYAGLLLLHPFKPVSYTHLRAHETV